jgi:hypothetical protein
LHAVADAYRAFARYREPVRPLDICGACCVSEEIDRQLCEWPLKRLKAQHFNEYNGSAKSEVQDAREVGYFLPRMLELLAEGDQIHHSLELSLDRLGRCPQGSWTPEQQSTLSRYALAYFDAILIGGPLSGGVSRWLDDPLSVLLMFDIGALETEPLLEHWLKCEHPFSTVQFVQTTYWDFWRHREYSNAFATSRPDFRQKVRAWLLHPEHRRKFALKMLSSDFLVLAEALPPTGHTTFDTMIEGVFEQLTQ